MFESLAEKKQFFAKKLPLFFMSSVRLICLSLCLATELCSFPSAGNHRHLELEGRGGLEPYPIKSFKDSSNFTRTTIIFYFKKYILPCPIKVLALKVPGIRWSLYIYQNFLHAKYIRFARS
jgi:hypothetical protein